jgi:hypothetical protein
VRPQKQKITSILRLGKFLLGLFNLGIIINTFLFLTKSLDEKSLLLFNSMLSKSEKETYNSFQFEYKSVEEIMEERCLAWSTLTSHLVNSIEIGLPIDINRLNITFEEIDRLEKVIRNPPINSSKKIKINLSLNLQLIRIICDSKRYC